jgi:type IV secretory pathway VirB2 component (pilin)
VQPSSEDPEAPAGEVARRCSLCLLELSAEYFTLNHVPICPICAQKIRARSKDRGNLRRAAIHGGVTAGVLTVLWSLLTMVTGRPLPFLAVPAGIAIGIALHRGSTARGGFRVQLVAALLVYATFVARYVPQVFGGIADAIKREHAARIESPPGVGTTSSAREDTEVRGASSNPRPPDEAAQVVPSEESSIIATLKAYFIFSLLAWGIVLASPFVPGTTGTLTLLSLLAGMAFAVGLNRRARMHGPFPP